MLIANFLVPNATFIVELIAFVVVLALAARFIIPPIDRAMKRRQDAIADALAKGDEAERRLIDADAEYRDRVAAGRRKARLFVERSRRLGDQLREDARRSGEEERARRVARAQADIERAMERARRKLHEGVDTLPTVLAGRTLGEGESGATRRHASDDRDAAAADVGSEAEKERERESPHRLEENLTSTSNPRASLSAQSSKTEESR
ncbi:MAG TPA: F0F1 ATP synthase subunit B [Acidimicrobiales bacterium]